MKKLLVAVVLAAATFAAVHHRGHHQTSGLAFDRVWIDHLPRGERDLVEVFVALDDYAIGQFIVASRWTGKYDAFQYEAHDDELRAVFPQTGQREQLTLRAKKCEGTVAFDFCLEIAGSNHGVKRYYSQEDWIIERGADLDARVKAIVAP
jgi:hypothetical protein